MSSLFGAQFTKSRCHWRNDSLYFLFYYHPLSIFCFHDSNSRGSSFTQVFCRKRK